MSTRTAIPESLATVCLTSCGRPDLLWRSLDSFLVFHEPERMIVSEDSEDADFAAAIRARYPRAELLFNQPRKGQFASLDAMYGMVKSPFVLHLEDDWHFDGPVPFEAAAALFAARQDLSMISFRSLDELNPKYRRRTLPEEVAGRAFRVLPPAINPVKFGYSFNPGLTPVALWREHGPFLPHHTEARFSKALKDKGYTIAYCDPGVARHIGDGRHVGDPFTIAPVRNPLRIWAIRIVQWFRPMHGR